jgi:hypothetical protein
LIIREKSRNVIPLSALALRLLTRPSALVRVEMKHVLRNVPRLVSEEANDGDDFEQEFVQRVATHGLDFILGFELSGVNEKFLKAARYGVWAFQHGSGEVYRGLPCLREILKKEHIIASRLEQITEENRTGVVLREGYFKTYGHSYARTVDSVLFGSAIWPTQVCVDILNGTAEYLKSSGPLSPSRALSPGFREFLSFLVQVCRHSLNRVRMLFMVSEWNLGIICQPIQSFVASTMTPKVYWLPSLGKGKFLSDPFGILWKGRTYVSCEFFDYRSYRGRICVLELDKNYSSKPKLVIEEPHHLSHPFLLEHEGRAYCVPESSEAGEVALYRADEFPYRWSKVKTLIRGLDAVDSTIFRHEKRWWLTCCIRGENHRLFIWYSDDLFGPWRPHVGNPVKTDIRSARPGGTPFVHNGQLYRPSQDCSATYGGRVILNRIKKLTPLEFEESQVGTLEPIAPYLAGLHTVSAAGNLTVIDGKKRSFPGLLATFSVVRAFLQGYGYRT